MQRARETFKPIPSVVPAVEEGRSAVTKTASDEYVFRAGPLRNVVLTAPYFHAGQVWSLKQAVGIMGASRLEERLTDQEEDAIVAFLQTLTGEQPKVELPMLPPRTDGTPLPGQMNGQLSSIGAGDGVGRNL